MSKPPAESARAYVRGARDSIELAQSRQGPRRRRRGADWRVLALETIAGDLRRLLDAGCTPDDATAEELSRLGRRLDGLCRRLSPAAGLAASEAIEALHCAQRAIKGQA